MSDDAAWMRTLATLDIAAAKLRRSLDALLDGHAGGQAVATDLAAVLDAIPPDVLDRRQHPLSVAATDLRGTVQQALDGRKHATGAPEWLCVIDEGARASLVAFEQALAKLLRGGSPEH